MLRKMRRTYLVCLVTLGLLILVPAQASEMVDFSLPGMDGKEIKLSSYRGKWVLVNFWATWCPPCLEEIPELIIFHETHQDDSAVVIGVNYEKVSTAKVKRFIETYSISYPVVIADPAKETVFGWVSGLPTSFLVNPSGEVIAKQVGPVTSEVIEQFISSNTDSKP